MKKLTLAFCFIFTIPFAMAQSPDLEWAKQVAGPNDAMGSCTTIDARGNTYTTGLFYGTADFDPSTSHFFLTATGLKDIFVTKTDASGNFKWAIKTGSVDIDEGVAIAVDSSGNVYTTGYFSGTADFDPSATTYNLTPKAGSDIFISKLDSNGKFKWAKQIGGQYYDAASAIAIDPKGNIYINGYFRDTVDFDPGIGTYYLMATGTNDTTHNDDAFLLKLDPTGQFTWAVNFGGNKDDEAYGIALDASGNIYMTGIFQDSVDFDFGSGSYPLVSSGSSDIFVSKTDKSGNFVWARKAGGSFADAGLSIVSDNFGNTFTTGYFLSVANFNPKGSSQNLSSRGSRDIFILRLQPDGNIAWVKQMGGVSEDVGICIAIDGKNNIYTTGYFWGTADFNPANATYNLVSYGKQDIFISKLDASGNYIWAKNMGSTSTDIGICIATNDGYDIYGTGYFYGSVDFDPGANTFNMVSQAYDAFVLKLKDCSFIDTKITQNGRIIEVPDISLATYQWIDCDNNNLPIPGRTFHSFNTIDDGNYGVIITLGSCTVTSPCFNVTSSSINSISSGNIRVYPNPSAGVFNIFIADPDSKTRIEIYNTLGILVYKQPVSNKENKIDLSSYTNGLYILKVTDESGTILIKKILKE